MIYLDNAATTFPKPECVYKALDLANRNLAFNAGRGSYKEAADACHLIDDTRKKVAGFVGRSADSVIFSSSATEALNQIIYGLPLMEGDTVVVSPFEHNAVSRPLYMLAKTKGIKIEFIPFDKETWELDEESFQNLIAMKHPRAVFVSQISNVTGYLIPYEKIFKMTKEIAFNVLDASQGYGIVPINNPDCIDYLVFAGHKSLYASFGIAGFIVMHKDSLNPVKAGGTGANSLSLEMEDRGPLKYEAGSPNIIAIAGLNASIDWLKSSDIFFHEQQLTISLLGKLEELSNIHVYKPERGKLFGIVSISVDGYSPEDVGTILYDEFGIAVRTGFHCAPFVHEFLGSKEQNGTVRLSLGAFSSEDDIILLLDALKTL